MKHALCGVLRGVDSVAARVGCHRACRRTCGRAARGVPTRERTACRDPSCWSARESLPKRTARAVPLGSPRHRTEASTATRTHRGRPSPCASPACRLRASRVCSTGCAKRCALALVADAPRSGTWPGFAGTSCFKESATRQRWGRSSSRCSSASWPQQDHVAASTEPSAERPAVPPSRRERAAGHRSRNALPGVTTAARRSTSCKDVGGRVSSAVPSVLSRPAVGHQK